MKANRTNFPLELAHKLARATWPTEFNFLYYHQNIARIYIASPDARGLLVYHGTGMGKSMLAASIAMDAIFPAVSEPASGRRVIVLLARSLANNMQAAIEQYIEARRTRGPAESLGAFGAIAALPEDKRREWIRKNFNFVSMNAANMYAQMSRASFISEDDEDRLMDTKAADFAERVANLDGKLLIVDEAHNLFRAIINGSQNSENLYRSIIAARNLKIIFLTGTPIASHPFELAVCFNMLAGSDIFPTFFNDFARLFIGRNGLIEHRGKFQNRIFGLVSHVSYTTRPGIGVADLTGATGVGEKEKQRVEFPQVLTRIVQRVPMDVSQYDVYITAREREREEGMEKAMRGGDAHEYYVEGAAKEFFKRPKISSKTERALVKPKSVFSSTYRVHSRQIGNFCPPLEIRKEIWLDRDESATGANVIAMLDRIGAITSAKFAAILARCAEHRGQLGLVYSQFIGLGGLAAFARFLDQNGYKDNYALITGEVAPDERAEIIKRFCAADNRHAEKCALLLVSATGAEGLDLKNVRHVHILEPYWNMGRIQQVEARAIRHASHADLPAEERNVQTYIYLAVAPEGAKTPEKTSDEELYDNSRENAILIESFEDALKEVSIECAINHIAPDRAVHCRICAPNDTKLFTENIEGDILGPDPCRPIVSSSIDATAVAVGDETFYYRPAREGSIDASVSGYEIFTEDSRLHAWRHLLPSDARYLAVVAAINASTGTVAKVAKAAKAPTAKAKK